MPRAVYVNGDYLPEAEAKLSVFDRGFLFADAVYEITCILDGKLIDFDGHMKRLERSLRELDMAMPMSVEELFAIHCKLVVANEIAEGLVYVQVSRGVAERDFDYPAEGTAQSVVLFTQSKPGFVDAPSLVNGIEVVTVPDERWARRDIKTVQLLYPSMAKMQAKAAGADNAWMVEDGFVTEGTSNNAYIVRDGTIVTRQLGSEILPGITRTAVLRLAEESGMRIEERPFTVDEARLADEAFITSASAFVTPVVKIDDAPIGTGEPGPVTTRLREVYLDESRKAGRAVA